MKEEEERREEGKDFGNEELQRPERVLDNKAVDLRRLDECSTHVREEGDDSLEKCCDSPDQSTRLLRYSGRTGRCASSLAQGARAQSRAQTANPGASQSRWDCAIHQFVFAESSRPDAPPLAETISSIRECQHVAVHLPVEHLGDGKPVTLRATTASAPTPRAVFNEGSTHHVPCVGMEEEDSRTSLWLLLEHQVRFDPDL